MKRSNKREKRGDINSELSKRSGLWGALENLIRRLRTPAALVIGALILTLFGVILGLSISPGVLLILKAIDLTQGQILFF